MLQYKGIQYKYVDFTEPRRRRIFRDATRRPTNLIGRFHFQ